MTPFAALLFVLAASSGDPIAFAPQAGSALPNVALRDRHGAITDSARLFDRPALLVFAYYRCAAVCAVELARLSALARDVPDERLVVVSIDPSDTPADAAAQFARYAGFADRHFLVGEPTAVHALAAAAGVRYLYDPIRATFVHPSGVIGVGAGGVVRGAVAGVAFTAQDLRALERGMVDSDDGWQRVCGALGLPPSLRTRAVLAALRLAGLLALAGGAAALARMRRR